MQAPDTQKLLREGIAAAKVAHQKPTSRSSAVGNQTQRLLSDTHKYRERARELLLEVVEIDHTNVQAWLWLSTVMDDWADKATCLDNVLELDPDNKQARAGLAWIERKFSIPLTPPIPEDISTEGLSDNETSHSWAPVVTPPHQHAPSTSEHIIAEFPPEQQATSYTSCPFCNRPISRMDVTCPHCQLPLVMDCPDCTTLMDVEWETCHECGYPMGDYRLGSVYFYLLAMGYQQHQQINKALEALRIAEKMDPDQPDLYRLLGEFQHEAGHIKEAIATLERAVELEPEQIGPYLSLGKVLKQEGHWPQAEEVYREAMHVAPDSSDAHCAFGDLMMQRGQRKRAYKHLRKAIKLNPQHGLAWARLGQIYESSKKRPSAIRAYYQAAKFLSRDTFEWEQVQSRLNALDPSRDKSPAESWTTKIKKWFQQ